MNASGAPGQRSSGQEPGQEPGQESGQGEEGPDGPDPGLDAAAAVFVQVRPQLFGIVYRMLGSVPEAEDVVQDAWIRWHTTDRSVVRNPHAYLTTTTTRLAINVLHSARVRHETYQGPWLPEPADSSHDPVLGAEQAEALDVAVLVLLERLTPTERAAYVLREAFEYAYADIADVVQLSQAAARQLVCRARKQIVGGRRAAVLAGTRRALLDAFVTAARTGDLSGLERLFAEEVAGRADGAGRAGRADAVGRAGGRDVERPAMRFPDLGRRAVARVLQLFTLPLWWDVALAPLV